MATHEEFLRFLKHLNSLNKKSSVTSTLDEALIDHSKPEDNGTSGHMYQKLYLHFIQSPQTHYSYLAENSHARRGLEYDISAYTIFQMINFIPDGLLKTHITYYCLDFDYNTISLNFAITIAGVLREKLGRAFDSIRLLDRIYCAKVAQGQLPSASQRNYIGDHFYAFGHQSLVLDVLLKNSKLGNITLSSVRVVSQLSTVANEGYRKKLERIFGSSRETAASLTEKDSYSFFEGAGIFAKSLFLAVDFCAHANHEFQASRSMHYFYDYHRSVFGKEDFGDFAHHPIFSRRICLIYCRTPSYKNEPVGSYNEYRNTDINRLRYVIDWLIQEGFGVVRYGMHNDSFEHDSDFYFDYHKSEYRTPAMDYAIISRSHFAVVGPGGAAEIPSHFGIPTLHIDSSPFVAKAYHPRCLVAYSTPYIGSRRLSGSEFYEPGVHGLACSIALNRLGIKIEHRSPEELLNVVRTFVDWVGLSNSNRQVDDNLFAAAEDLSPFGWEIPSMAKIESII